jgi:hypothetical protein
MIAMLASIALLAALAEPDSSCAQSAQYMIVEGGSNEVGTDFLVKYKTKDNPSPRCEYKIQPGDLEIKNEFAEYFMALQDRFLILDSGTGPEPRGLIIWDLDSRKKVYSGTYSGPYEINPGRIEFWMETGEATDENCPRKKEIEDDGLGAAIETHVTLRLPDLEVVRSAQTRCTSRQ